METIKVPQDPTTVLYTAKNSSTKAARWFPVLFNSELPSVIPQFWYPYYAIAGQPTNHNKHGNTVKLIAACKRLICCFSYWSWTRAGVEKGSTITKDVHMYIIWCKCSSGVARETYSEAPGTWRQVETAFLPIALNIHDCKRVALQFHIYFQFTNKCSRLYLATSLYRRVEAHCPYACLQLQQTAYQRRSMNVPLSHCLVFLLTVHSDPGSKEIQIIRGVSTIGTGRAVVPPLFNGMPNYSIQHEYSLHYE